VIENQRRINMSNRNKVNIIALIVTGLLILGVLSGIATAQPSGERNLKAKEKYQEHKEKYFETKQQFESAKQEFEKTVIQFSSKKGNISRDELKEKTRIYLERAIDHTMANLEVLRNRTELSDNKRFIPFDASKIIDDHKTSLGALRIKVEQANTTKEFQEASELLHAKAVKLPTSLNTYRILRWA